MDRVCTGLAGRPRSSAPGRSWRRSDSIPLCSRRAIPTSSPADSVSGSISRALALEPKVVVLDEPVSALDKSVEAQVLNLLVDLKRDLALTYVFISHDLNVVQYMSDRVLVMYLGKVVEVGPVESIYGDPRHPYTRALLGAMPSMDPDRRGEQPTLTGDPPNPINPPTGCRFHTRCAHAESCCAAVEPALAADSAGGGHLTACHMLIPGSGHSAAPRAAA
jgi:peptide/nickel transport system ATP-binding protein